jgi:hypothetical protein
MEKHELSKIDLEMIDDGICFGMLTLAGWRLRKKLRNHQTRIAPKTTTYLFMRCVTDFTTDQSECSELRGRLPTGWQLVPSN